MPRVVHFEIHADNPERAVNFYKSTFGWEITKWGGPIEYWLVMTGPADKPGCNGGLMKRMGPPPADGQPVNSYVCTVDVPSADEYANKAVAAGGKVVVPKKAIPGVGWLVYLKDTEGNIFGMMQEDRAAK